MPSKTVPLSVRISDEDAEFLSSLEIGEARTPSEKLRALLASERQLRTRGHDLGQAAEMISDLLRPAQRRIKQIERQRSEPSEALRRIYDRLPDLTATALAGPQTDTTQDGSSQSLSALEDAAADQALALCEDLLRLHVSPRALLRASETMSRRLHAILELAELIKIAEKHPEGE
ncbi:MAG: hypothetical protein JKP96_01175 [Oceanicaulis sp.]|jgi:hypothetical protein|nr:hypothetical protein [Oceanicaulis sp.]